MNQDKIQKIADTQRSEAKRLLNAMLNVQSGYGSDNVSQIVDCIISAAMLETTLIMQRAQKETNET